MGSIARREGGSRLPDLFEWFEGNFPFPSSWHFPSVVQALRIEDYVEGNTYTLRIELPGIDPEKDVNIDVRNGVLSITAERSEETRERNRSEFRYGRFARTIALPQGAVEDRIEASYRDGILTVMIPLTEQGEEARRIAVRRGD
jgi:HSP20 family protein